MNQVVKIIIAAVFGILVGIGVMFCVNLLPEPYSEKDIIVLNDVYIPTIRLVSENAKLVSNEEISEKELLIKYDAVSFDKELLSAYATLLEDYGYRLLRSNLESEEDNSEWVAVSSIDKEKLVYVECKKNSEAVSIKYSLEQGDIEVWEEEKYFVYDAKNQYYDVVIDDRNVKVLALENVVQLTRDTKRDFTANNYVNLYYEYDEHTTGEQKDAYLDNYGKFLLENGFSQGKNEKEFSNGIVKISIMNDFNFSITITKQYNYN